MSSFDVIRKLAKKPEGTIVLVVMDGVGGLPQTPGGQAEQGRGDSAVRRPENLDRSGGVQPPQGGTGRGPRGLKALAGIRRGGGVRWPGEEHQGHQHQERKR